MYHIVRVYPRYSEVDNSLLGYNLVYARDGSNFNQSKFYTTQEAKTLFGVNDVSWCQNLVWKEVVLRLELKK